MMDATKLATQIEAALESPEALSGVNDAFTRRRLSEAASKLNLALEAGGDTIHRITNAVWHSFLPIYTEPLKFRFELPTLCYWYP